MPDLASRIKQHDAAVRRNSNDRIRYRTVCAVCGKKAPFAPHELRRRGLRYIAAGKVISVSIVVARWRCRHCRRAFTDYPPFCLAANARFLAILTPRTACLHRWDENGVISTLKIPNTDPAQQIGLRNDGQLVAIRINSSRIYIWNAVTAQFVTVLFRQPSRTHDLGFGDDGQHLLSVGGDGTSRVWRWPNPGDGFRKLADQVDNHLWTESSIQPADQQASPDVKSALTREDVLCSTASANRDYAAVAFGEQQPPVEIFDLKSNSSYQLPLPKAAVKSLRCGGFVGREGFAAISPGP